MLSQLEYFRGDALGSVRQLLDRTGELRLGESYEPYGEVLSSAGGVTSSYSFAEEVCSPPSFYRLCMS